MKFELLYMIARVRGLLPDNHKGNIIFGKPDKNVMKQMYYRGGFVPYRIDNLVTYR